MSTTLTIHDETTSGQKTRIIALDWSATRMTVREIIRARIDQEVQDYNQHQPEHFRGLVAPIESDPTPHGYKLRQHRQIDGQQQFQRVLEAFDHKGFQVMVGDQIAQSLDQEFEVRADTDVGFVKLTPLVAG